ncbi:MAG: cytochrome c oxidase subunit II [Gammaproteobacteria bacterium]|nr:cytochrome c oxidase subunit II [Gammaproteobacteria bacterium]
MTSFLPPADRIWWKVPVGRQEIVWIGIALTWCLIMFFMMPAWHVYGKQNLSNEAYRTSPAKFMAKVQAMVDKHTVRKETAQQIPVVAPPAGSDVYLQASLWRWYPILELKKGESYRLHLSSTDWQHGLSLQPKNINLQVVPGYEMVLNITPNDAEDQTIVCNEYCGVGHHTMLGKIYVTE